ncbi:MAG: chloride channel protein [Terricaulis sp.]
MTTTAPPPARRPTPHDVEHLGQRIELLPAVFRRYIRSREIGLTIFAALIGVAAAACVALMNFLATVAHRYLFGVQVGDRLSGLTHLIEPWALTWPLIGGGVLVAMAWFWTRIGRGDVVDPIEANALHGGHMSFRDSVLLSLQTLVSNGFGASVGLEAGYTQISSAIGSIAGRWLNLRREDMRIIVGCGAAGGIAAAFNGPFTGAFYAFELVLAQYAIGNVAPVIAASIAGALSIRAFGGAPFALFIQLNRPVTAIDIGWFALLGIACAGIGIVWMRMLPLTERLLLATRLPRLYRPLIGGAAIGLIGAINAQTLSGGHGALENSLFGQMTLMAAAILAVMKMVASAVSIGSGFRGGLFFSSLLTGALIGRALALTLSAIAPQTGPDPAAFALVGMGALAAAVIGAPLTMSFLVLETTSDYTLTAAVLAASVAANLIVRETFGFSFSTWRFHLRGETIRSAKDVGWARALTVGRLMRTNPATAHRDTTIGHFQLKYPLGSRNRVALTDEGGRYCGIVEVAAAHAEGLDDNALVSTLARETNVALLPTMSAKDAMRMFDITESDTLAVIENKEGGKLVGTLKETYLARRYAEELEKASSL